MEELAKRKDIIITNAEKGDAVVMMGLYKYIKEANHQLCDKRNYNTLHEDPTLQHSNLVNDTNDRIKKENLLSKKLVDGLKSVNPKPPKFYISPIMHKENNPAKPAINSTNYPTSEISHRQPLVWEIASHIKGTNYFIHKNNSFPVPPNSLLVTIDVKSLCTSIPDNEGFASFKKKYDHYPKKTIPAEIIATFLALLLVLNIFIFNSKFYLHIKDCAMGTICVPAYANIFMSEFEEKCLPSDEN